MRVKNNCEYVISVAGLGYIGLPTALFFASAGFRVKGYDKSDSVRTSLNEGTPHIFEPNLDVFMNEVLGGGHLSFHAELQPADVYLICVPTPFKEQNGARVPDLSYVLDVAKDIACHIKDGDVVILESTSPVGTTELVKTTIQQIRSNVDFGVAYCPERVLPGKMLDEFQSNPRIVGSDCDQTRKVVSTLYEAITKAELHLTDAKTAEMCKLVENSFRDVNIAFANELSILADANDVNVWRLIELANLHPRVNILTPGVGVGGHCISVDPWFLVASDPENSNLIAKARHVNDEKPNWVFGKCVELVDYFVATQNRHPKIAVYGLAFKPDVDDFRESPALQVCTSIAEAYPDSVVVVEPYASPGMAFDFTNIEQAYSQSDIHIFLVAHSCFKNFLLGQQKSNEKVVFDVCGIFESL